MRNLKLLDCRHCKEKSLTSSSCISVDNDTGVIYTASQHIIIGLDPNTGQVCNTTDIRKNDIGLTIDENSKIISIQFIPDLQAVCIAITDGTLLQWTVFNNEVEEVGCVASGIKEMCWSPDLELLILATGEESFILMTREYDPIIENSLHVENFGEAEFVTVGWGKKETQFHGSIGKGAAKQKQVEVKPSVEGDDLKTRISWRGDGFYFVTSAINKLTGARQLRVWTREGALHSTSEPVDGLGHALAWKPSGSLIISSQRSPAKNEIVFFEKNGLRHGEFTLPFADSNITVREMLWNIESTILCVWCQDMVPDQFNTNNKSNSYIQLWTVNNYHWYLKQSLRFTPDQQVLAIQWDPEHAYRLHIVTNGGNYHQYTWCWATNHSAGRSESDQALVGVIDGNQILMSPFRKMVVPPPMSAYNLNLPLPAHQVAFCQEEGHSNNIAVLLQNNNVAFYRFNDVSDKTHEGITVTSAGGTGFNIQCQLPSLHGIYSIEDIVDTGTYPLCIYHMLWIKSDLLVFTTISQAGNNSSLYIVHKDTANTKLIVRTKLEVENYIYNICRCFTTDDLAVQLIDGTVLKYHLESESLLPWENKDGEEIRFPTPSSTMAVCQIDGQEVVLGLTDRYRFYVNNVEVASNCSSFAVHSEFLVLTTLSHTCRCISLHTKLKDLPTLSDGKDHPFDEAIRRVERGSRIVLVVPDDIKLILQMPRGNLEGIYPRALVLSAVKHYLNRLDYKEAFTIMKKHRINMNLLYDHNPKLFLQHVTDFIQQVSSITDLNIFITALQQEDVTVTMYTASYQTTNDKTDNKPVGGPSKVDVICDSIRSAFNKLDPDRYLLCILTTYVRKTVPELEAALELIQQLTGKTVKNQAVSAEEALKYLLFLVDVNQLYDVALGTYDFDLVLMVAEKSQKDPKEYIPFLNDLRRLEDNYRKYTIDKHLRLYHKALKHISHCGSDRFSECLKLIEDHKLYVEGLKCFSITSTEYKQIATRYGNYLLEKNRHDEAGVMFVKAEEWELALEAFTSCKNWRQVFCMTARLGYTADREAEIGRKIAVQLKETRQHLEASVIYEQYVKDNEECIVTLIEGEQWEEAQRMMYKYDRSDFIETNLKPCLTDKYNNEKESLESLECDFIKYKQRLYVVRNTKDRERLAILEGGGAVHADSDLFSDTSSAAGESVHTKYTYDSSRSTVFSKMTGKSRKKGSVRKWNLKEGSMYEDCALIEALAKIITTVTGFKEEMNMLLKTLVQYHYDEMAGDLQEQLDQFLSLIDKSIPEIWKDTAESTQSQMVIGPSATANSIAQAMQQGRQLSTPGDKLEPVLMVPPQFKKDVRWKLHMVQKSDS